MCPLQQPLHDLRLNSLLRNTSNHNDRHVLSDGEATAHHTQRIPQENQEEESHASRVEHHV